MVDLGASVSWLGGFGGAVPASVATRDSADAFATVCDRGVLAAPVGNVEAEVAGFDVVVTESLDLPIDRWRADHPGLIVVVVSPLGRDAAGSRAASSDLVDWARSGYLRMTGEPGRPPLKPSVPFLAQRHAGTHALMGLMLALRRRRQCGLGSTVDVSARDTHLGMLTNTLAFWSMAGIELARQGHRFLIGDAHRSLPSIFEAADGYVVWLPYTSRTLAPLRVLVAWMADEGEAPVWLIEFVGTDIELEDQAAADRFVAPFAAFFRSRPRRQLWVEGLRRGFLLAPVAVVEEVLDDPQLEDRDAWVPAADLGPAVHLPRGPVRLDTMAWEPPSV